MTYTCWIDDKLKKTCVIRMGFFFSFFFIFLKYKPRNSAEGYCHTHRKRDSLRRWHLTGNCNRRNRSIGRTFNRYKDFREKVLFGSVDFDDDTKLKHLKLSASISKRQNMKETLVYTYTHTLTKRLDNIKLKPVWIKWSRKHSIYKSKFNGSTRALLISNSKSKHTRIFNQQLRKISWKTKQNEITNRSEKVLSADFASF